MGVPGTGVAAVSNLAGLVEIQSDEGGDNYFHKKAKIGKTISFGLCGWVG